MTNLEKELLRMCRTLADGYDSCYPALYLTRDEKDICDKAIERLQELERGADQP